MKFCLFSLKLLTYCSELSLVVKTMEQPKLKNEIIICVIMILTRSIKLYEL